METNQILKKIIIGLLFLFLIKSIATSGLFKSTTFKSRTFSIEHPIGWQLTKDFYKTGVFVTGSEKVEKAVFVTPDMDPKTKKPLAVFAVFYSKLPAPSWIDDLFPDVLKALVESGYIIKDKGQIDISSQKARWILTIEPDTGNMNLEFYFCDEQDGFYKFKYTTAPDNFKKYRKAFEDSKNTFKFKVGLF